MGEGVLLPASEARTKLLRAIHSPFVPKERIRARKEAEFILEDAKRRARQILAEANAKAGKIMDRAKEEGERLGRKELAAQILSAKRQLEKERKAMRRKSVAMALEMARRIVRDRLRVKPESIREICRQVLEEHPMSGVVTVCANPADFELLGPVQKRLEIECKVEIQMVPDEKLERGDIILRGTWGEVDASVETQLGVLGQIADDWMVQNELQD